MICELNAPGEAAVAGDEQQRDRVLGLVLLRGSAGRRSRRRPPRRPGGSCAGWRPRRAAARAMRCSARRRRAAATISIARVIFWMFLTDAMRFLTSRWRHAVAGASALLGAPRRLRSLGLGARTRRTSRRRCSTLVATRLAASSPSVERLALLVEVVAEVVGVVLDRALERSRRRVAPSRRRRSSRGGSLSSERTRCCRPSSELLDAVGVDAVDVAVGGGVDDRRPGRRPGAARARSGSASAPGAHRGPACAACRGRGRSRTARRPRGRGTARARSSGGRRPSSSA